MITSQNHTQVLPPAYINTLPTDILKTLFWTLSPVDLARVSQVCKAWNNIIAEPMKIFSRKLKTCFHPEIWKYTFSPKPFFTFGAQRMLYNEGKQLKNQTQQGITNTLQNRGFKTIWENNHTTQTPSKNTDILLETSSDEDDSSNSALKTISIIDKNSSLKKDIKIAIKNISSENHEALSSALYKYRNSIWFCLCCSVYISRKHTRGQFSMYLFFAGMAVSAGLLVSVGIPLITLKKPNPMLWIGVGVGILLMLLTIIDCICATCITPHRIDADKRLAELA